MIKFYKRFAVLLLVLMCFSALPLTAYATNGAEVTADADKSFQEKWSDWWDSATIDEKVAFFVAVIAFLVIVFVGSAVATPIGGAILGIISIIGFVAIFWSGMI